jgi:hypothetical protein
MRTTLAALAAAALIIQAGCPRGATPAAPETSAGPSTADDAAALRIPPTAVASEALARLASRAAGGDAEAAWARAHYLVDLFDDARFRRDAASLALLFAAVGEPDPRPDDPGLTDRVLSSLLVEVDAVLRADRLHGPALAARTLLEFDYRPPADRREALRRVGQLKAVARGDGPLAASAALRLYGYCAVAFEDALRARWADRPRIAAHCLYPLYDADPEPYFADDPAQRPPPPRWRELADEIADMLDEIAGSGARVAVAARAQRRHLAALAVRAGAELPAEPDPDALGLRPVAHASAYDYTPLLTWPGDDAWDAERAEALALAVRGDGRQAVALALDEAAPASALHGAAQAARAAGAAHLEILVATHQRLRVPPGDYWAGRLEGDRVARAAVVPLSLAPLVTDPDAGPWEPRRGALALHLEIGGDRWRLVAPTGELGSFAVGPDEDAAAALRAALIRVQQAFADEDALVLVPEADVAYGALVTAALAAAHRADGQPLFPRLGLGREAPRPSARTLPRRIERRWRATAVIEPALLAPRTGALRRCYQGLLEQTPRLSGAFRLDLDGEEVRIRSGPAHRALRACVLTTLAGAIVASEVPSAAVTLSPEGTESTNQRIRGPN